MTARWKIQRRRAGWPRYRVVDLPSTLGRTYKFWTLWGARRWIAQYQWHDVESLRTPTQETK